MLWVIIPLIIIGIGLLIYANRCEANSIGIQNISVLTDRMKGSLTVLQLSDLHLFKNMSRIRLESLKKAVKLCMDNGVPDLVLLTGDYIDRNSGISLLPEIFNELKSKYGMFAVFGNHDYYQYNFWHIFSPAFFFLDHFNTDLEGIKKALTDSGIKLLLDETAEVVTAEDRLEIIGIDALQIKKGELKPPEGERGTDFCIALSHYPDAIKAYQGRVDLMLSGHTHGGQITFFGYPLASRSKVSKSDTRGVSVHKDSVLYVSKGAGVSHYVPFRFFARPDITVIRIQGGKHE